ncbi:DUF559 domain-containing protein [Modestobacter sp. SYSU DS0657]
MAEGLLTREQLLRLYRRVLRNVYAEPGLPFDHELRSRAAALLIPADAVLGGRSAAVWWGAPTAGPVDPVTVIVPPASAWRGPQGVRVHRSLLSPGDVTTAADGPRITSAERTAWDVATLERTLDAVACLDGMAHAQTLSGGVIRALVAGAPGRWRGRRAASALSLVDGRAQSPPESWLRVACHLAGLPAPVPQFDVVDRGKWLGQVDLAWPEAGLIVEYEGAYHFEGEQIVKDDARYERLIAAGWRVIRLLAADLRDLDAVVARIRAAL